MTKTDLIEHQRRFEWDLARTEQTRHAGKLVAGKTHDLLNLVQIVKLASEELGRRCDATGQEFIADLQRAAADAESDLLELMAIARPEHVLMRGDPVGAAVTRAVSDLRNAVPIDLHLAITPDTCTALTADEIEHLVIGIALDAGASGGRLELFVRDRTIAGVPWVELVCGCEQPMPDAPGFDLRAVELLATRAGGELTQSDRRGGGSERIVALPVVAE